MNNPYHSSAAPDLSGLAPQANPTFTGTASFAALTIAAFPSIIGSGQVDSGTALTLSATNSVVRVRLTGNATLTLPASPTLATNARTMLEVELVQDGTGGRTVIWGAAPADTIEWDSSTTAPLIATAAGKETHFVFRRRAGSTVWYAAKIWHGV